MRRGTGKDSLTSNWNKDIGDLLTEYKNLDGIYENIDQIKGAMQQKLKDGQKSAYFSQELIKLCDTVPCPLIDDAINAGYKVLIIDSLSHEWKWLNDQHDKMPGNSFQNWGKLKPKHSRFMDKVLNATIHIIATARGKDEWVMEDKNGKQVPKKVGLGAVQDKEVTYNYTVSFILEQDTHIANADKDNTHLFEDRYEPLTEKDGKRLIAWANSSDIPATVKVMPKINEEKNEELTVFIKEKFTKADADTKTAVKELMAEYGIKNFKEETVYDNSTEGLEKIAELLKSKEESK